MATLIDLTPEFEERLNLLASETGRSKEYFPQEIIERGTDDIEDYYLSIISSSASAPARNVSIHLPR